MEDNTVDNSNNKIIELMNLQRKAGYVIIIAYDSAKIYIVLHINCTVSFTIMPI